MKGFKIQIDKIIKLLIEARAATEDGSTILSIATHQRSVQITQEAFLVSMMEQVAEWDAGQRDGQPSCAR